MYGPFDHLGIRHSPSRSVFAFEFGTTRMVLCYIHAWIVYNMWSLLCIYATILPIFCAHRKLQCCLWKSIKRKHFVVFLFIIAYILLILGRIQIKKKQLFCELLKSIDSRRKEYVSALNKICFYIRFMSKYQTSLLYCRSHPKRWFVWKWSHLCLRQWWWWWWLWWWRRMRTFFV